MLLHVLRIIYPYVYMLWQFFFATVALLKVNKVTKVIAQVHPDVYNTIIENRIIPWKVKGNIIFRTDNGIHEPLN